MSEAWFLPVRDVADIFAVSVDVIYDLIHEGVMPATKVKTQLRVPARAIDEVLAATMADFDPHRLIARLEGASDLDPGTTTPGSRSLGPAGTPAVEEPHSARRRTDGPVLAHR